MVHIYNKVVFIWIDSFSTEVVLIGEINLLAIIGQNLLARNGGLAYSKDCLKRPY